MPKNTSITPGNHFDGSSVQQVANDCYASASEVVDADLRILKGNEQKLAILRRLLEEGEKSGLAQYSYEGFLNELDDELVNGRV